MEPTDADYEHCGGCGCLSECGCACPDCRGAVRTMTEVGHGEGCNCTKPEETMASKVKALELQIEEMKNTAPLNLLFAIQEACQPAGIASGLRLGVEILIREYKETLRLNGEYRTALESILRGGDKGTFEYRTAEAALADKANADVPPAFCHGCNTWFPYNGKCKCSEKR